MNKGSGDSCLVHELEKQRTRKAEPQGKRETDAQLSRGMAFPGSPHFHSVDPLSLSPSGPGPLGWP